MLAACGLQAVPLGTPLIPGKPLVPGKPDPLTVSMAIDDSDEERIAKLMAGASPDAEQAEAEEQSRRSAEAAFRPIRGSSVAREDPYGAGRHSPAGFLAGAGDGTFREPAVH